MPLLTIILVGIAIISLLLTQECTNSSKSDNKGQDPKLFRVWHGEKNGFIDKKGKMVTDYIYDEVNEFSEGLAAVKIDNKWGYINESGKLVINPQFDSAGNFSENLAAIEITDSFGRDEWGYIDKSGKYIIIPRFQFTKSFSNGLAAVKENDVYGFIDKSGNMVINQGNESCSISAGFSEEMAMVFSKETIKTGFMNTSGEVVIKPQFDYVNSFSEGLASVEIGSKFGFIDKKGNLIINPQYDKVTYGFTEGLDGVLVNNKWGFINKKGEFIIQPTYDDVDLDGYSNGLVAVKVGEKWGYIDKNGKEVISPQFDTTSGFKGDIALVSNNSIYGYINIKGNYVWQELK